MSAREIAEWAAYAKVEPFGETRANWHMAVLASLLYNSNRGQDAKPLDVADFMWKIAPTKNQAKREEKRQAAATWGKLMGWAKGNQAIEKAKTQNDYTG